VPYLTRKT